jgi:hypothetical protein
MKMSSRRWSVEGGPIAQHRPQDVNPAPGQCDQGLGVSLPFSPLAIVEGSGLRRTPEAGKGELVKGSFEDFVPTTHPLIVAGAFAGVVGCGDQPGVRGELIGALEGREISNTDQELGAKDHTHPRQASDDRRLLSGEKRALNSSSRASIRSLRATTSAASSATREEATSSAGKRTL